MLPLSAVVALLGLAILLLALYRRARLDLDLIPSATLLDVLLLVGSPRRGHAWLRQCHEKYGPIFRCRVLHREIVMVADTLVAQQVLTAGPSYLPGKSFEYSAFDPAHGLKGHSGMVSHRDERVWKVHRGALAPAYTLSALKPLHPSIMSAMVDLAHRIGSKVQEGPADICLNHEALVAAVQIVEAFMKLPMAEIGVDAHEVVCDMELLTDVSGGFIANPLARIFYSTPLLAQLTQAGREFHAARTRFAAFTENVVTALEKRGPYAEKDFSLAACLLRIEEPCKPGQRACKAAIAAEVANSLYASETVPSTIAWTVYLLATHPEVEQRVLAELEGAGVPIGGAPADIAAALLKPETMKQLTSAQYFQAVVSESMRLHPAGGAASNRVATRPTQIGPYRVPAGVLVWPCAYSIMTYSGNWERPLEFDPERWLSGPAAGIHPETGALRFVPFSIGPKACAGQNFALLEVRWSLAMLLACFRFKVARRMGTHKEVMARTEMGFVYQPPGGIWFETGLRSPAVVAAVVRPL